VRRRPLGNGRFRTSRCSKHEELSGIWILGRLFSMEAFPVTGPSPRGSAKLSQDSAVLGYRILHDDDGRTWRAWFQAAGLEFAGTLQQQYFTDYSLTLAAAEVRQGVTLGALAFVEAALRSGRLIRIGRTCIPFGSYWLLQVARSTNARRSTELL
jgi:hypothetical protein